jgi:hypothetical protein
MFAASGLLLQVADLPTDYAAGVSERQPQRATDTACDSSGSRYVKSV